MLKEGSLAPDFKVKDHTGKTVSLSEFKGKTVILWFYPKADTPGCTAEGCGFRDRISQFNDRNVVVLGISFDTVDENRKFADKFSFPFQLLCDTGRDLGIAYGAAASKEEGYAVRIGYVVGPDGKIKKAYPKVDAKNFPETVLGEI